MRTNIVIGSGPAGVACAHGLLQRGGNVRLLDAGLGLEPERQALVQRLGQLRPEQWNAEDLAEYQAGMIPEVGGVPLKLVYGSDFAYREADEHLRLTYSNVGLRPSFARGGLSNVWGAAVMPYAYRDINDWPLGLDALAKHYSAVLEITGLAAVRDSLEKFFPLYTDNVSQLQLSRQAGQLLETMEAHRGVLTSRGIHFGRSRLAVRGKGASADGGCVYCRLCMYGCPYGHIYSAADSLKELQNHANFSYQTAVIVDSVRESSGGVEICGYERQSRKALKWECERAFVAAGPISTTRILLRSLDAYDTPVWLKDSQYFLVPLLLLRRRAGTRHESLHALSQLFMEMCGPLGNERWTHVQIYSNNDLINQAVEKSFGGLRGLLRPLLQNLQDRLLVAQGFLHSDHSSRIGLRLQQETGGGARLELRADLNPRVRARVKKIVFTLLRNSRRIGAVPLAPLLKLGAPGRSFHSGGSFPMCREPRGFQTDLLGRPPGWNRVHAVDATILPSIPATTITLSVMANAHRIGWEMGNTQ